MYGGRLVLLTSVACRFVCFICVREQILIVFGVESDHKGRAVFDYDVSGRCYKGIV